VFDANDHSADNFPVAFAFGEVVPPDLSPKDLRPVQNFETVGIIDFNLVGDVRTVDDGNIVPVARLHKVDSLVKIQRLIHDNYIVKSTGESQIKS
jgi:hypothetical protein